MKSRLYFVFCLLSLLSCRTELFNHKMWVTFEVHDLSGCDKPVFIAGTFNQWNPGHPDYCLIKAGNVWTKTILLQTASAIEYKFTRGSWESVEKDSLGIDVANRVYAVQSANDTVRTFISRWGTGKRISTVTGHVEVINDFPISQLGKTRTLRILLPDDYHENLTRRYPVIYMHDGQNLFDDSIAFNGEWGIDESLKTMFDENPEKAFLVVGIDNGPDRLSEYSPWPFDFRHYHSSGEGGQYAIFLAETLKPYIDSHYRTLTDPEKTMIAGSSMGGLISLYTGLTYPHLFGLIGAMSSTFSDVVVGQQLREFILSEKIKRPEHLRIYLDIGTMESAETPPESEVKANQQVYELLKDVLPDGSVVILRIIQGGQHRESDWEKRFPHMVRWLYDF